ncbi:MAG: carboxypeptidase-like regulatory domain-containing protein [Proteobacteria bacterium]|nr:carboxypeptidase-like regulatory domain-containing protein [Pseudomonadota bacterium]
MAQPTAGAPPEPTPPEQPAPPDVVAPVVTPPAIPAKKIIIVGKVINAFGKPVRGAVLTIEGSPTIAPAKTDKFGAYRIDDVPVGSTIVVDHEGYQTGLGTATGAAMDDIVLL